MRVFVWILAAAIGAAQPGILKVGFDIDDTVLYSRDVFLNAPRPGMNGETAASFLTDVLGFEIIKDKNLFFAPKETINGKRFTTKHRVMNNLNLDLYYGDSDTDMIAAIKAGVQPVRIVRHTSSIEQYGGNYFGNTLNQNSVKYPFSGGDRRCPARNIKGRF